MADQFTQAPFLCPPQTVAAEWIDYNGHLNMAYYHVLFDRGVDAAWDALGIGEGYLRESGSSCFTLETHVCYLNEIGEGDAVRVDFQLLDFDHKRLHFFQRMTHAVSNTLVATSEQLAMHVDMTSRRSASFPADALARIEAMHRAHERLPAPEQAGRRIGIRHG